MASQADKVSDRQTTRKLISALLAISFGTILEWVSCFPSAPLSRCVLAFTHDARPLLLPLPDPGELAALQYDFTVSFG